MPSGYFDRSIVAGPFSKRSTRALVSASIGSSAARATLAPVRASASAAGIIHFSFMALLESIDSLERESVLVQIQRVAVRVDKAVEIALEERVRAFEDQRVGDVIVEAQIVLVDVAALLMFAAVTEDR